MSVRLHRPVCVVLLAALSAAGCASAPPAGDSRAELEALFRDRLAEQRTNFTDADVRFMSDMIHHHAQALVMAELAAARGASPAVQTLAARIRNSQVDEIAYMQQWLRERSLPVPEVPGVAGSAHAHHASPDVAMPGMLTPQQLAELERARGLDFDRLFLVYMIGHHRGAVTMVDELLTTDGAAQDPAVFQLASDIQADQHAEIARMQRMLATLFGGRTLH